VKIEAWQNKYETVKETLGLYKEKLQKLQAENEELVAYIREMGLELHWIDRRMDKEERGE
jgi:predicted nuclease with TOPRIM domain